MNEAPRYAQSFADVFDLRPSGADRYVLTIPFAWGGPTLAAATRAACLSEPAKALRSIHGSFLGPVQSDAAIDVEVERIRDGRLLSHRRVRLLSGGRLLFKMSASFSAVAAADPQALRWQEALLPPGIPGPDTLADLFDVRPSPRGDEAREPVEWRVIGTPWLDGRPGNASAWDGWVRPSMVLPQGPGWDRPALALLSDSHSDWSVARKVEGYTIKRYASLDTMVWFHRPPLWKEWLFVRSVSEVAEAGFALGRRSVYDADGALVATSCQEALYR
jgi:acyl-CoA thioesterase-2